jgi:hypothetical protein
VRPLVLTASERAVEQARALGIERPLENVVAEALIAGGSRPSLPYVNERPVHLGDGVVVLCARVKTGNGRRAWKPLRIERRERAA